MARAGWGLTVLNAQLKETARLHGPVPGWHQDITLAESLAFMWYLRHAGPAGGTLYTDSKNVLQIWQRGPAHGCNP
eukprot:548463-Karenia_brevis.AAC.1